MKYQRESEATTVDRARTVAGRRDGDPETTWGILPDEGWTLHEISSAPMLQPTRGRSRAVPIVIAAIAAVVSFGFAGHLPNESPSPAKQDASTTAPSADPAASRAMGPGRVDVSPRLVILRPVKGERIGGIVPVIVRAAPGARVHVSVVVGDAVLGWTNAIASPAGLVDAVVHVFAPAASLPAEVRAESATQPPSFAPVILAGSDPVTLWSVSAAAGPGSTRVRVDGSAPLTVGAVTLLVLDGDGDTIGRANSRVAVDDGRAGSYGGRLLGLGSFRALVPVTRGSPDAVRVRWTDSTDGLHDVVEARVPPGAGTRSTLVGPEP